MSDFEMLSIVLMMIAIIVPLLKNTNQRKK